MWIQLVKWPRFNLPLSLSRQVELVLALIGIVFYTGVLAVPLQIMGLSKILTLLRYSMVLLSLLGILSNWKETSYILKEGKWIWPLVLLSILSVLWSLNPPITIQSIRSDLIPITLFGIYLAVRFSHSTLFRLITRAVLFIALISLLIAWLIPSIGRHPFDDGAYPGAWRGLFSHKNSFGFNLILTNVFISIRFMDTQQRKNIVNYGLLFLLVAGTILSDSLAALLISCFTIILTWLYCHHYRWRGKPTILALKIIGAMSVTLIGTIATLWTPIMTALGKDPTMSARTEIWGYVLTKINESPILGFGRAIFWKTPHLFAGVWEAASHVPGHAHNGYIELMTEIGYVGLFLLIVALIPVLTKVLKLAYQSKNVYDIWPLAFMIIFLISNSVESFLLRDAQFAWLIFVTLACSPLIRYDTDSSL